MDRSGLPSDGYVAGYPAPSATRPWFGAGLSPAEIHRRAQFPVEPLLAQPSFRDLVGVSLREVISKLQIPRDHFRRKVLTEKRFEGAWVRMEIAPQHNG